MLLLNPGPVNLTERVRHALLNPDLCHREPEFSELQARIRAGLVAVHGLPSERYTAVLMTGSGTAAVEAMLTTLMSADGRLLVLENGVYGERMSNIARIHGIGHARLSHAWGDSIEPDRVGAALDADPSLTHVAVVHHETTTGRLNDLAAIGAACRARGRPMLVDAVSSFGAEILDCDAWNIQACAATANKCLHAVPGTSFVVARRADLERDDPPARSLYLDLRGYLRNQDAGGTPFTQSVQTFYALDEALRELAEAGGAAERRAHYARLQGIVREGMQALGIAALIPAAESSVVLSAYRLPAGLPYRALHDRLKARGFVIYAGQGSFAESIFRVSTMGAIVEADMHRFVDAMSAIVSG
ncbi:MAG: 2-aminoethylphosphonate aminotransferase [Gammaproteobacteria bacterium]